MRHVENGHILVMMSYVERRPVLVSLNSWPRLLLAMYLPRHDFGSFLVQCSFHHGLNDRRAFTGVGVVAATDVARLLRAFVDELAYKCVLPDATRHPVGAGQRDGGASRIPSRCGKTEDSPSSHCCCTYSIIVYDSLHCMHCLLS